MERYSGPKSYTTTLAQIPHLAATMARHPLGGQVIALVGPLGTGKTTFVKALGKELSIRQRITSPTFVVMQRYPIPKQNNKKPTWLYHLDAYRTSGFRDLQTLGLEEFWQQPDAITLIEWADRIASHLPKHTIHITFHD